MWNLKRSLLKFLLNLQPEQRVQARKAAQHLLNRVPPVKRRDRLAASLVLLLVDLAEADKPK